LLNTDGDARFKGFTKCYKDNEFGGQNKEIVH